MSFDQLFSLEALDEFGFPFVEKWPVDRAGAEIGHMLILVEAVDRTLQQFIAFPEGRTVARPRSLAQRVQRVDRRRGATDGTGGRTDQLPSRASIE